MQTTFSLTTTKAPASMIKAILQAGRGNLNGS